MTLTGDAVHTTEVQMRFADTDALGHVNNGSFIVYAESARLDFLKVLGSTVRSLILARVAVDFRRQVIYGERISVDTWVERIGSSSVTLGQVVYANGERAADVSSVVVSFDYAQQRATPWNAESRSALETHLHPTSPT